MESAKLDTSKVIYDGLVHGDALYRDYDFITDNPCILIQLSHSLEDDMWYALYRQSETSESEFDDGVQLAEEYVQQLVDLVPESDRV